MSANVKAYHLGNARIMDRDFSHSTKVEMPHFGNAFTIEASQLIWKGNAVRNSIKARSLQEDLAALNFETDKQNIKLLVLSYYLELYKVDNQDDVYRKNIELAQQRLLNINRLFKEGMVTRNDVIRGELQLSNLKLALEQNQNNREILNTQLTVALGLPETVKVTPAEGLLLNSLTVSNVEDYQAASKNHPSIRQTQKALDIYQVTGKMIAADRLPYLAAFAGNQLQRPITSSTPALDMYANGWSAGLSLGFNIDALYTVPKRLRLNKLEKAKAQASANEAQDMISVAIHAAYIKHKEAVSQNNTYTIQKNLAAENYRIMESKYNNQLAILLDLIDASNAKLDAELQFANSKASIIYSYYKLLKETGIL